MNKRDRLMIWQRFHRLGWDTLKIAKYLKVDESVVYNAMDRAREDQKAEK